MLDFKFLVAFLALTAVFECKFFYVYLQYAIWYHELDILDNNIRVRILFCTEITVFDIITQHCKNIIK